MSDDSDSVRLGFMQATESAIAPLHEWLAGQRNYFLRQGYTPDEARAMSAALFVTVFGSKVAPPEEPT